MRNQILPVLLIVALSAPTAAAHKINCFAYAEGTTLHGEAYARGGDAVRGATVEIFDPAGEKLGETVTDEEGNFTFEVRSGCDHRIVVDAGAGHQAEYTVPADELPADLPGRDGTAPPATAQPEAPEPAAPPLDDAAPPRPDASLGRKIDAVASQVAQLRRDLDRYQQTLQLRDMLGGIGYILGLMGLAFYFLGVRKRDAAASATPGPRPRN